MARGLWWRIVFVASCAWISGAAFERAWGRSGPPRADAVDWVSIPGGTFVMGSEDGSPDEKPTHEVKVGAFLMAKTEVTVEQYKACVDAGACKAPGTGSYCNWGRADRKRHPVNCLEWDKAKDFARWVGGRLPTEAEWEYAARSAGRNWKYPWGDEKATCERAVIAEKGDGCGQDSTWPVCSKQQGNTKQGLCDMAGNVWEWVQDWYHASYERAPVQGGAWESESSGASQRTIRGGAWYDDGSFARVSARRHCPGIRNRALGLRPVRSVPK